MSTPFDPLDERNRDKRTRRKSSEVEFEKKQWRERVESHFRRAIESLQNPEVVDTETIRFMIENDPKTNLNFLTLRRTFEKSMVALNYVKLFNPGTKDGRFKISGSFVFVYCTQNHRLLRKFDKKLMKQLLTT